MYQEKKEGKIESGKNKRRGYAPELHQERHLGVAWQAS